MQITIYSTTSCPYCKALKDYLASNNATFTEKLIDQDELVRKEMEELSGGFMGVPFVVVTKEDGTKENIIGFDKGKLNQILNIQS